MRFKLTLLLLLANAAVFYLIWSLGKTDDAAPPSFGVANTASVERLRLEGRALESPREFVAERGGNWRLTAPVNWAANPHAVNGILSQLQSLAKEIRFPVKKVEEGGRSLADYGLDDPVLTLTVVSGGAPSVLQIGALTQIGDRVYAFSPADGMIIVAPQELLRLCALDLDRVRSNRIFTIPDFEVRGISVRAGSDDLGTSAAANRRTGLVKTGDGWRMETPVQARADDSAVEAQLSLLCGLEANRFVSAADAAPATYGLNTPALRIALEGNRRETLLIGRNVPNAKTPRAYAQIEGNPAVFTLDTAPLESLRRAYETLRDRHVLSFDPAALTAVEIKGDDGASLRLQRLETGAWRVMSGGEGADSAPKNVDAEALNALGRTLLDLSATAFATDAPSAENLKAFGLAQPVRVVALSFGESKPLALSLGRADDGSVYAATNESGSVYKVHPSILEALPLSSLHYRDRKISALPETAALTNVRLVDLQTQKTLAQTAGLSEMSDAQKAAFETLCAAVRRLDAARYVGAFDAAQFSAEGKTLPWRLRLTAEAAVPTGADKAKTETVSFDFTARDGGTLQYGGSAAVNAVFALPQAIIDALWVFTDTPPSLPPQS